MNNSAMKRIAMITGIGRRVSISVFYALLSGLLLCACGPFYKTEYSFHPPASFEGQRCVDDCGARKTGCATDENERAEREVAACRLEADHDYELCLVGAKNDQQRNKCSKRDCSSFTNFEHCENDYRICFQACGGVVESRQVCQFNCPQ